MGLLDERWEVNGTVYTFRKMTAMEQYKVAVKLLPALGPIATEMQKLRTEGVSLNLTDANEDTLARFSEAAVSVLSQLPEERLEMAREGLFPHIEYARPDKPGGIVARDVDVALQGQDFTVVFQLIVRSFAVNFTGSSLSQLGNLVGANSDSSQSTQS